MQTRLVVVLALTVAWLVAVTPIHATESDAQAMLDTLKSLEGTWQGTAEGTGTDELPENEEPPRPIHEFRVSAAGTVVMETMNPGTDHEMINMYHLDGDELMLTHYCAGGNQPSMRLVSDRSTPEKMVFDFAGGTNLDPAVDGHIHAAEITMVDSDHVISEWIGYQNGAEAGVMTFDLERVD